MIKNIFKSEPINVLDLAYNDRFLYNEIIKIKKELKVIKKRKFNQNDYIPVSRLDLMRKKLIEKGVNSTDLEEKKKIQYTLGILYQLNFKLDGE